MLFRFTRIWVALGLLLAVWGFASVRRGDPRVYVRPLGTRSGPVKILNFYANVGSLTIGQKALLCYGVENAKAVRISPSVDSLVYPSPSHCMEVAPEHTTHYTILAEGYDGGVATQSFTLAVQDLFAPPRPVHYADIDPIGLPSAQDHQPHPQPQQL